MLWLGLINNLHFELGKFGEKKANFFRRLANVLSASLSIFIVISALTFAVCCKSFPSTLAPGVPQMFPASKDEVFYDSLRKILKNNGIPGEVEMKAYSDFVVVMKQIVNAFYRKRLEV